MDLSDELACDILELYDKPLATSSSTSTSEKFDKAFATPLKSIMKNNLVKKDAVKNNVIIKQKHLNGNVSSPNVNNSVKIKRLLSSIAGLNGFGVIYVNSPDPSIKDLNDTIEALEKLIDKKLEKLKHV